MCGFGPTGLVDHRNKSIAVIRMYNG